MIEHTIIDSTNENDPPEARATGAAMAMDGKRRIGAEAVSNRNMLGGAEREKQ